MQDLIDRQVAIGKIDEGITLIRAALEELNITDTGMIVFVEEIMLLEAVKQSLCEVPSAQPDEAIPHRNYERFSGYWCECGWYLGKRDSVKFCPECGRKVKWDE